MFEQPTRTTSQSRLATDCSVATQDDRGAPARWPALPDEALLACVADRQCDALWEVYRRYSRATYLLACSVSGEQVVADDVVVGVFIDFWLSPHAFASESRRDSEHALPSRLLEATYHRSLQARSAAVSPSPNVGAAAREAMTSRHAFAQMSRAEREVLVLILADFGRDEIAAVLALSTRVVPALLRGALVYARHAQHEHQEGR